jgi:hypothetical protein
MITAVVITVDDDLAMCGTSRSSYDSARIIASLDNFADIFRASGICLEPEVPSLDFIRFYQRLSDPSTFVELPKIGRISQIILTNLERNWHRRADLEFQRGPSGALKIYMNAVIGFKNDTFFLKSASETTWHTLPAVFDTRIYKRDFESKSSIISMSIIIDQTIFCVIYWRAARLMNKAAVNVCIMLKYQFLLKSDWI